ncbi:MAG: cytosolic protein [Deltaproteobacteria bacterium]|nr:cytosolic protein [Deltaproteobacteria bacterium]MBN2845861.1 cytosolic protein [Deltaproteobacteria bacterium]
MNEKVEDPENLDQKDLARYVLDMFHRTLVHYTLWFMEVEHQMGMKKSLDILKKVKDQSYTVQMNRLAKVLGFEMFDGIPKALLDMTKEELLDLTNNLGVNWIANDGIWFQAVENVHGMNDAKRCNDSCWTRFSPFEAWSIKEFLGLPEKAGIEGLKKALRFRMYARINVQSIIDEGPNSIMFQMNDCRVQSARKRRGLDDYPCKSAGLVEYAYFAEAIDSRITTECIGCPPDPHPEEWFCAWRFTIPDTENLPL